MVKKNRKIYVTTILSRDMFESTPEFEIAKQLQKMLKTKEIGEGFYTYNCKVQIDNDTAKYRWIDFSYVDKFGNKGRLLNTRCRFL